MATADIERHDITAGDLHVACLAAGPADGPLALCLHGFPDHAPTWTSLLADLAAAGFRAVAPWMRGYAPTAVPADGRYQTAALALDVHALGDALSPDRPFALVGHDWGAAAAYHAAVLRPDRVRRLVGLALPPLPSFAERLVFDPDQIHRSWYTFFFQLPVAEMAVQANDFALIEKLWRDWSPGFTAAPGFMRGLKDTLGAPGATAAALGYYRAAFDPSGHAPELADLQAKAGDPIPVEALYLHGLDDGCLASEVIDTARVEACFPAGVTVERIEQAGHFLHLERPEVVNPRVLSFLA